MMRGKASSTNPLELVHIYPFHIKANFHYEPHTHEHHELIVMQQGRLRVRVSKREHFASLGDILLYPAGVVHEEWAEDDAPVLTLACGFRWGGLGRNDLMLCRDTHGLVHELVVKLAFEFLIAHLTGTPDPGSASSLSHIIAEIKRLAAHDPHAMVDQVRAFIAAHIEQPFILDDLATVSGLSKSHFVRQYRTITGRTPMEDARFMRVAQARRLIVSTALPLHEIAPQVGICDEFHLSHLLKEFLGVSARELRQSKPEDPAHMD